MPGRHGHLQILPPAPGRMSDPMAVEDTPALRAAVFASSAHRTFAILPPPMSISLGSLPLTLVAKSFAGEVGSLAIEVPHDLLGALLIERPTRLTSSLTLLMAFMDSFRRGRPVDDLLAAAIFKTDRAFNDPGRPRMIAVCSLVAAWCASFLPSSFRLPPSEPRSSRYTFGFACPPLTISVAQIDTNILLQEPGARVQGLYETIQTTLALHRLCGIADRAGSWHEADVDELERAAKAFDDPVPRSPGRSRSSASKSPAASPIMSSSILSRQLQAFIHLFWGMQRLPWCREATAMTLDSLYRPMSVIMGVDEVADGESIFSLTIGPHALALIAVGAIWCLTTLLADGTLPDVSPADRVKFRQPIADVLLTCKRWPVGASRDLAGMYGRISQFTRVALEATERESTTDRADALRDSVQRFGHLGCVLDRAMA